MIISKIGGGFFEIDLVLLPRAIIRAFFSFIIYFYIISFMKMKSDDGNNNSPESALLQPPNKALMLTILYGIMNLGSATGVVLANKAVFQTYEFHFPITLTCIHTLATAITMRIFAMKGIAFFVPKRIPASRTWTLALAFVGYVVFGNWSLDVNSVGFYQLAKILVAPTVVLMQYFLHGVTQSTRVKLAVALLCVGVAAASVSDVSVTTYGFSVAFGCVVITALYQIWAGSKQKELHASSMQLLHEYTPIAFVMMLVLIPLLEPSGMGDVMSGSIPSEKTVLGFPLTFGCVMAIFCSTVLGVLVSLSTFLFIGVTSTLTYNVAGHLKTVLILAGGVVLYGDDLNSKKALGLVMAMAGIVYYTHLKIAEKSGGGGGGEKPESLLPVSLKATTEKK